MSEAEFSSIRHQFRKRIEIIRNSSKTTKMYRNAYQRGILTIFFSVGSKPLSIWDVTTQDGYVTRFLDQDIKSMVLEIGGTNVSTTYITCPKGNVVLGITMPFLVMIVKNLKKYFSFEVTILDETSTRRRFRVSNFQSTTQILPLCTVMPIALSDGWNQIQFNLAEFTRRAYKKQFVEVQKVKINANIRLRRIYFTERLIPEEELAPEYKLYFPLASKGTKDKKTLTQNVADKENIEPSTSKRDTKTGDAVQMVDKLKSEVKIGKPTSIHSIKKVGSHESRKSKINVETIPVETTTEDQAPDKTDEVTDKTEPTDKEEPIEHQASAEENKEEGKAGAAEGPVESQESQDIKEAPKEITETEPAPAQEAASPDAAPPETEPAPTEDAL